jgi:hypothetical protein
MLLIVLLNDYVTFSGFLEVFLTKIDSFITFAVCAIHCYFNLVSIAFDNDAIPNLCPVIRMPLVLIWLIVVVDFWLSGDFSVI